MENLHLLLSVLLMGLVPAAPSTVSSPVTLSDLLLNPPASVENVFPGKKLARNLSASGAVILDLQSGQELFARNGNRRRAVGSLTKIMTAVVIAESHKLDEVVTIPSDIGKTDGTVAHLPPGAHFTVGDLLSAMLIASANDAAETLAQFHSGSSAAFVTAMNDRAQMLGLKNTLFANASGLDDTSEWSTPRDMAWLAAFALRNPDIRSRMSTMQVSIKSQEGKKFTLEHTHELLRKGGAVIAGKTGTTVAAGQCLLSVVTEHGREYLVVLLGSSERYVDMRFVLRILGTFLA